MRISTLRITNFRSFGPDTQEIVFKQKLSGFIGLNSAGKTAALEALRKLFGDRIDRNLNKEDFHTPSDEDPANPGEKTLTIEVDLEFEDDDPAVPLLQGYETVASAGATPFVRIQLEATWSPSPTSPEGEIEAEQCILTLPDDGSGEMVKKGFPKSFYGLFQVIYIPALRKTADQLRVASGSIMHRLLKNISFPDDFRENIREGVEALNALFTGLKDLGAIQNTLQDAWEKFHRDSRYKDATMRFASGEVEEILKKLEIQFSPAPGNHRQFSINDLGDGYRSLFYITLVCALLRIEQSRPIEEDDDENIRPVLTLLLVEEPENHIAPQLLGRVIRILKEIATTKGAMVMLSSHTPAIVKRIDPEAIFHFRITDNDQTEVNYIELPPATDDAYKYVKEAVQNYPEIYFAKLVVIGEGDSEDVIFNHLMKVVDLDFDDNIITFAPLGHRFVNHIWKLLKRLHIPHVTLLDLDLGRTGGGWGRIQYALQQLIEAGEDENKVLATTTGKMLSAQALEEMPDRDYSEKQMQILGKWLKRLETFNVFFSADLDLDFLMLKAFPEYYKSPKMLGTGTGPKIPRALPGSDKRQNYIDKAVLASLKHEEYPEDLPADLYDDEEKELMVWYRYHFLNRGKPVTHMQALTLIPEEEFEESIPEVFKRIFERIKELL